MKSEKVEAGWGSRSHSQRVLRSAAKFCSNSEILTDLTFVCNDGSRFAHRHILSQVSPMIQKWALNSVFRHDRIALSLEGISVTTLDLLLQFLYCGQIRVPNSKAIEELSDLCSSLGISLANTTKVSINASTSGQSDISSEAIVYCLCREPERGVMIGCDYCVEWYHAKCISLSKTEVKELRKKSWKCPLCDFRSRNENAANAGQTDTEKTSSLTVNDERLSSIKKKTNQKRNRTLSPSSKSTDSTSSEHPHTSPPRALPSPSPSSSSSSTSVEAVQTSETKEGNRFAVVACSDILTKEPAGWKKLRENDISVWVSNLEPSPPSKYVDSQRLKTDSRKKRNIESDKKDKQRPSSETNGVNGSNRRKPGPKSKTRRKDDNDEDDLYFW